MTKKSRYIFFIYGITIFLSAFLLFQVQPLISKFILPWFGGSTNVWTMSMLFFQSTLLIGYIYSHLVTKYLSPKKQITLHIILLVISLIFLPIIPGNFWKTIYESSPTLHIILLLASVVGLPAIILSTTSSLSQVWISRLHITGSVYRLYALSNFGSLLALLSFPFVFEPLMGIKTQAYIWSGAFACYVLLMAFCGIFYYKNYQKAGYKNSEISNPTTYNRKNSLLWVIYTAIVSVLFLAITNKITQDISVVPFFWVVPLSIYLLTFILAFNNNGKKTFFTKNIYFYGLLILFISILLYMQSGHIVLQIFNYLFALLYFGIILHYEVVRIKPDEKYLTAYYLYISLGGVIGGVFVGILAPIIFNTYFELPLIIAICIGFGFYIFLKQFDFSWQNIKDNYGKAMKRHFISGAIMILFLAMTGSMQMSESSLLAQENNEQNLSIGRNFYSVLRVNEMDAIDTDSRVRKLISGHIIHGIQMQDEERKNWPTSYYNTNSGLGILFEALKNRPLKIGAIGLGVGTIAAYTDSDDSIIFYEINSVVKDLAYKYFTYLDDAEGKVDIEIGDARISLEGSEPQNFDVLVLDAFSGDAIPVHLLTKEAFEIYLNHMSDKGVIAAHISNRHIDLTHVLARLAEEFDLNFVIINNEPTDENIGFYSEWVLLSKDSAIFDKAEFVDYVGQTNDTEFKSVRLWTDNYTNILNILK